MDASSIFVDHTGDASGRARILKNVLLGHVDHAESAKVDWYMASGGATVVCGPLLDERATGSRQHVTITIVKGASLDPSRSASRPPSGYGRSRAALPVRLVALL